MKLLKITAISAALLVAGATATISAEVPSLKPNAAPIGQLSTPLAGLPVQSSDPKAQTAIKVAQRWRRSRRRRNRGRAVAGAIALGIAAIIASQAARAHDRGHHYEDRHYGRKCRRWARLCDRGRDWACDKFDYRC